MRTVPGTVPIQPNTDNPFSRTERSRRVEHTESFSKSLSAASNNLNAGLRTVSSPHSAVPPQTKTTAEPSKVIHTPFGDYDGTHLVSTTDNKTPAPDTWRSYFMTSQPPEWWTDPAARAEFSRLYGAKALVTLDYRGTVPDNISSVWVTHVPLDPDGKPFLNVPLSGSLT